VTVDAGSQTRADDRVDGHRPSEPAPAAARRRGPRARRAALVAALALGGAGAAVAAVLLLGNDGGSPSRNASSRLGSTVVERRTLVQRESADGTLGYSDSRSVYNRLRGGTITWVPDEGAIVRRGHRLYAVDGQPVVLLYGHQPAYRPLGPGVSYGADVAQLQRNLAALGYYGGSADGHFGASTRSAVQDWQRALGLRATGTVELGRVVFFPGARRVGQISAVLGAAATPAEVMKTTSMRHVINVSLSVDDQAVAKKGARVQVTLPDESVVSGRVTSVGDVAEGRGSQATVPVTVRLTSHRGVAGLDQAPVSVSFAKAIARRVLAVPVTALLARTGGTYAVQAVAGGRVRTVPVSPGLFADGYVEVAGRGLRPGMHVENAL
jgi:peptidoglycan hydrolase-like protein with peptidoglycan-binding domain